MVLHYKLVHVFIEHARVRPFGAVMEGVELSQVGVVKGHLICAIVVCWR